MQFLIHFFVPSKSVWPFSLCRSWVIPCSHKRSHPLPLNDANLCSHMWRQSGGFANGFGSEFDGDFLWVWLWVWWRLFVGLMVKLWWICGCFVGLMLKSWGICRYSADRVWWLCRWVDGVWVWWHCKGEIVVLKKKMGRRKKCVKNKIKSYLKKKDI